MLTLLGNKIAVDPIFDSDILEKSVEDIHYTKEEKAALEAAGGFKTDTISQIIIPDEAKEKCDQGLVKYVGPDVRDIRVGDYVLFSGYSGTTLRLEGEGIVIILPEDFIVCKVEPPETDIEGLYFRDNTGQFWTVTYEMVTQFMRKKFEEMQPVKNVKVPKEIGKTGNFARGIG